MKIPIHLGELHRSAGPLAFGLVLLLQACATTTPVLEWRDESYAGPAFTHALVIGISENVATRRVFEDSFVRELKNLGVQATASASVMPTDQKVERETVKRAIEGKDVDAVIVTHLVGVEEKEAYIPPSTGPGFGYYGYYSYAWDYARSPGYYEKYKVMKLESNLYDVATEKHIWSMQSESMEVDKVNTLVDEVIKVNIQSLRNQKLI